MTTTSIPRPVIDVVEAARKLVHARRAKLEAAASGEVNEAGLKRRSRDLKAAITELDRAVGRLETALATLAQQRAAAKGKKPMDWGPFFTAAGKFADLVSKINAGDRAAVGAAARFVGEYAPGDVAKGPGYRRPPDDIIDGEFEEVK